MTTIKQTIPALYLRRATRAPDAIVSYHAEGEEWVPTTWGQALEEIQGLAKGLAALGVGPGVPVGILSETRREWLAVDMAALCLGGIVVGIYPTLLPEQVAYQLRHAEVRVLVVEDAAQAERLAGVLRDLPDLEHVLSIDPAPGLRTLQDAQVDGAGLDWLRERADAVQPDDTATWIYTSGTTGPPKGATLAHRHFVAIAQATHGVPKVLPGDRSLVFLPLAHSLQRFAVYRGLLEEDVTGWFPGGIDKLPWALATARPQILTTVPRMLEKIRAKALARVAERGERAQNAVDRAFRFGAERSRLIERGERVPLGLALRCALYDRLVFRKIREGLGGEIRALVSGGAALDPEIARWFHAMGVDVLEGWGLTETSAPATVNRADDFRFGTVGKPLPGVEIDVADDGEILVRSVGLFSGYHKDPEATARVMRDGWFLTGDLGEIDPDGFLKITGRKKAILVTAGGKNIPPVNIEQRIERHPLVENAVAIGDGRPYLVALLTPDLEALEVMAAQNGWPASLEHPEIQAGFQAAVDDANAGLARFEQIKRFEVLPTPFSVEGGELTPTMKLRRSAVSAQYAGIIEGLYGAG